MAEEKIVELPYYDAPSGPADPQLRNGIANPKINGAMEIASGTIFAKALVVGVQTWAHNIVWSVTDYNTVAWAAGSIQLSDGSSYAVASGNTGNMSARTYVYFNQTSTLQVTTTYSDAVGNNSILLAILDPDSDTAGSAIITALNSTGTTIDGDKIVTGRIQSRDGRVYYDLNLSKFVMNDSSNDRLFIGLKP